MGQPPILSLSYRVGCWLYLSKCFMQIANHTRLQTLLSQNGQVVQMRWCRDNFLNARALRKATDIYEQVRSHNSSQIFILASICTTLQARLLVEHGTCQVPHKHNNLCVQQENVLAMFESAQPTASQRLCHTVLIALYPLYCASSCWGIWRP
jgi:hypothetical protein